METEQWPFSACVSLRLWHTIARGDLRFPTLVGLVTDARCPLSLASRKCSQLQLRARCMRPRISVCFLYIVPFCGLGCFVGCCGCSAFAFFRLLGLCANQKTVKSSSCVHTRYTCALTARDATTQDTQRVGRRHRRTESRSSAQCPTCACIQYTRCEMCTTLLLLVAGHYDETTTPHTPYLKYHAHHTSPAHETNTATWRDLTKRHRVLVLTCTTCWCHRKQANCWNVTVPNSGMLICCPISHRGV